MTGRCMLCSVLLTGLCACVGCGGPASTSLDHSETAEPALMSGPELPSIPFLDARPAAGQPLEASINGAYAQQALEQVKEIVLAYDDLVFEVVGFTDQSECGQEVCQILSVRRAEQVRAWLISEGALPRQLLTAMGKGSEFPLDTSGSEEAQSVNRRVEVHLVP